jgi:hypothetical protein
MGFGPATIRAMKHHGIIAIVFVIGCATGGVAAQLVVPPVRAGTSPTRWEYQCAEAGFIADGTLTAKLNQLGAEGWELASMESVGFNKMHVACAKRALP